MEWFLLANNNIWQMRVLNILNYTKTRVCRLFKEISENSFDLG